MDILVLTLLGLCVAGVILFLLRKKKKGGSCSGCSCAGMCPGHCAGKEKREP